MKPSLEDWEAQGLRRQRRVVSTWRDATHAVCEGREYLTFCSNDYLGLRRHPRIIKAAEKTLKEEGLGSGASAMISGYHALHQQLEERVADFFHRPRALLFPTGFMANLALLSVVLRDRESVVMDKENHASLIDGARASDAKIFRYHHADVENARRQLERAQSGTSALVTEGVFSMAGDRASLSSLQALAQSFQAPFVVDDAHGVGVLGKTGRGTLEACGIDSADWLVGTFGKALGGAGAFVVSDESNIEQLLQFGRSYIYTTAIPPAIAAGMMESLTLIEEESWRREVLHERINYFQHCAQQTGLNFLKTDTPIQGLLCGDVASAKRLAKALDEAGLWVGMIRPPTVAPGQSRLRISLSAEHQNADIDRLIESIVMIVKREPVV